jgi:hypothetical protein
MEGGLLISTDVCIPHTIWISLFHVLHFWHHCSFMHVCGWKFSSFFFSSTDFPSQKLTKVLT